jgi:4'-phosphopantetheinyl transferase
MLELVVAALDIEAEPLAGLLSADERQRAERFVFQRDRRRYTVARARLRQLLGERLGAAPESLQFAYNRHGKPALARRPGERDLRFNVSHCGEVAAYAFTEGREVGVDVEEVRALPDADEVAMRFFAQRERAAYLSLPASERPQGFFNCWTRKEAFVKAIGEGLSHPLDTLDVSLAPAGWMLSSFVPAAGLVGAVAVQTA